MESIRLDLQGLKCPLPVLQSRDLLEHQELQPERLLFRIRRSARTAT